MPPLARSSPLNGLEVKSSVPSHTPQPLPVLSQKGGVLTLHFGSEYIQSQMVVDEPDFLTLAYTRTMMSFEMFLPKPRNIALIGLGGGSIAKWCYRHHAKSSLTVVEINPHVIAVREAFRVPRANQRFRILCEDGARFVSRPPTRFDLLLIDCFTTDCVPPELSSQTFYDNCRRTLTSGGLMVANLCGQKHSGIISMIRESFRGKILLSNDDDGNTVAFACKGKLLWPKDEDDDSLQRKLKEFERKYGLGRAMAPKG